MFQRTCLKILLGIVLLVLVFWTFSLFSSGGTHRIYLLHGEFYYSGKQMVHPPIKKIKQLSLPTEENRQNEEAKQNDNKKQPALPSEVAKQDDKTQPASSMGETKQVDRKQITSPPPIRTKQIDKNQPRVPIKQAIKNQPTLPPKGAKPTDKQNQPATPAVNYTVMDDHDLLETAFVHDQPFYGKYLQTLPASVIERLAALFGVGNLTTRYSQEQFLKCAGISTLRWLKAVPQELPVHLPLSRQHCKKMSFQASGPSVALVSYPGSGNSWIRQLLESATGIYTGAMYCDPSYLEAGMVGEGMDSENVIATKLHFWPSAVRDYLKSRKVIYVVRSPFAAILSENNRNVARNTKDVKNVLESHVMEVNFKYENNVAWKNKVRKETRDWKIHILQWLNYRQVPMHIVGYDNFKKDTYTELKKMLDFIGHPYTEADLVCAVKGSGESFHRNHTRKDLHPFSPELQQYVLNEIKQVDARLLKYNISLNHPYNRED